MDLRLLPTALAAWLTAGVAIAVPAEGIDVAVPVAWLLALAGTALAVGLTRASRAHGAPTLPRRLAPALALPLVGVALVLTVTAVGLETRNPEPLSAAAAGGRSVVLELVVTGHAGEGRIPGNIDRLRGAATTDVGSVPALVFTEGFGTGPEVAIGSRIAVSGRLRPAEAGDDRAWLVFADDEPIVLDDPPGILAAADGLRRGFVLTAAGFPAPGGGLLPGLAIGDTSAVEETLDRAMLRASLGHLTAVSGANCAVVVGLVFALARALGASRATRIGAAGSALIAFVILVTPEPSVLRAAAMAGAALLGLALGRPAAGIPLLCLSVLVLVVADPWLARSFGFTLSVLATAGLLVLAGPLAAILARWLPRSGALLIAVPTAAQLACQPVVLLLDPSLPLAGVPANVLAAPAAPIATVLGLLACLALPVLPPLGWLFTAVAWIPAAWIAAVAAFFSALPLARGPWPSGWVGIVLLIALTLAAVLAILPGAPTRLRRPAVALVALSLMVYPASLVGDRILTTVSRPADWMYAQCDVGQGDAVLIRSAGQVALVDTGPDPDLLQHCLAELGVDRIELLVLTHFDLDHVGGVGAVVGRVGRALVGPVADAADERLRAELAAGGALVEQPPQGTAGNLGELRWTVLWPPPDPPPGNPASIVLRVDPGPDCTRCPSAVLLGDLGAEEQLRLLGGADPMPVDVVKVSHHGSADQAAPLYERLRATVGLIGVGDNDYGHPTDALLGILAATSTMVLRSDACGLVLIAPGEEEGELFVWSERRPP